MGVVHTPESPFGRELWKWDHTVNERNPVDGSMGMRPVGFVEYPKMLYKARRDHAKVLPSEWTIVHSADEQRNMESRGYHPTQQAALDAFHAEELAVAKEHATRNFGELRMSDRAREEAARVEAEAGEMLGEIPTTPVKRRGRPAKAKEQTV